MVDDAVEELVEFDIAVEEIRHKLMQRRITDVL